jgi:hypothetical protein
LHDLGRAASPPHLISSLSLIVIRAPAAATHRADFERERCEWLMAEVLKATAEMMAAREAAARIAGEPAALRERPWWRRLAG